MDLKIWNNNGQQLFVGNTGPTGPTGGALLSNCSLTNSGDLGLSGSLAKLTWDTVLRDADGYLSAGSVVVPSGKAGTFFVSSDLIFDIAGGSTNSAKLYLNGAPITNGPACNPASIDAGVFTESLQTVVDLGVSDTLDVYASSTSGSIKANSTFIVLKIG